MVKLLAIVALLASAWWLVPMLVASLWLIGVAVAGAAVLFVFARVFWIGMTGGDDDLDTAAYLSRRR